MLPEWGLVRLYGTDVDQGTLTVVAAVAGAVGAVTGITALVLQAWQFHLSGPRVRVGVGNGLRPPDMYAVLTVEVTNVGRLPVTVTGVGVAFGDDNNVPFASINARLYQGPDLPLRLPDGESATWVADPVVLAESVARNGGGRQVRAFANLATGKRLRSRRTVDVGHLAALNHR